MVTGVLCCCLWAEELTKLHDVYEADTQTDTISIDSQSRKFIDGHFAELGPTTSALCRSVLYQLSYPAPPGWASLECSKSKR